MDQIKQVQSDLKELIGQVKSDLSELIVNKNEEMMTIQALNPPKSSSATMILDVF